jgi:phytoene dehydrogenase-like protein
MHSLPGGLCTSWRRKGYMLDGSVAGLAGSSPGSPLYQLWQEIGVTRYCPLNYGENFGHIHLLDGRTITIYTNINRLEAHLLDNFPGKPAPIRQFYRALSSVLDLDIPFSDAHGWAAVKNGMQTALSSLAHLPVLLKYSSLTIYKFTEQIDDPALATSSATWRISFVWMCPS